MHVCNCEHPKLIYNKYIRQEVLVGCGKCDACQSQKRAEWVKRLQKESLCWRYTYMIYLDYNDDMVPTFDFCRSSNEYLCERQRRFYDNFTFDEVFVSLKDILDYLSNEEDYERDYVIDRLNSHFTGLPHSSVRDIQRFKKLLNSYIAREITGSYGCFRSAIAAEIGPSTFRPHYHGLLFFNDSRIAENLQALLSRSWQDGCGHSLGHVDCSFDQGGSADYCSKYITKDYSLPKLYTHPLFSTQFLCSRHPPIGSLVKSQTEVLRIFHDSSPTKVEFKKLEQYSYVPELVPLSKNLKDQLFPKCPFYSALTPDGRTQLYKSVIGHRGVITDFDTYVTKILVKCYGFNVVLDPLHKIWENKVFNYRFRYPPVGSDFSYNIDLITDHLKSFNALKDLYYVGTRVWYQSQIFGVSFDYYLSRIYEFYDHKLPLYKLNCQYRLQDEVLRKYPDSPIETFYPETFKCVDLSLNGEYSSHIKDVKLRKKKKDRVHLKNDYLENKLRVNDPVLYNLIINYYAKKCDETGQAIA